MSTSSKLTDIDSADIQLNRSGDDLLVKILSTNETITVLGQFGNAADAPGMGLEYIQFANGDQWGRTHRRHLRPARRPSSPATNGNDTLVGSAVAAKHLRREAGNDTLDGQGWQRPPVRCLGDDRLIVSV